MEKEVAVDYPVLQFGNSEELGGDIIAPVIMMEMQGLIGLGIEHPASSI